MSTWRETVEKPKRLGYLDLFAAVSTVAAVREDGLKTNPILRYCEETPDKKDSWQRRLIVRSLMYPMWLGFIRRGLLWGIHNADSLLVWGLPPSMPPPPTSPLGRLLDEILAHLAALSASLRTPEQESRTRELGTKLQSAKVEFLGDRANEMMEVASVLTRIAQRGHGYASALIRVLTDTADREGRAVWLLNSNVEENTTFYNQLGFVAAGEIVIGDTNPSWTEEPIRVTIMVRDSAIAREK